MQSPPNYRLFIVYNYIGQYLHQSVHSYFFVQDIQTACNASLFITDCKKSKNLQYSKNDNIKIMQKRPPIKDCLFLPVVYLQFCNLSQSLEDSSDGKDGSVIRIGHDDTCLRGGCVNNLSISHIDSHVTGVAYDITGLCILQTIDCRAYASVRR